MLNSIINITHEENSSSTSTPDEMQTESQASTSRNMTSTSSSSQNNDTHLDLPSSMQIESLLRQPNEDMIIPSFQVAGNSRLSTQDILQQKATKHLSLDEEEMNFTGFNTNTDYIHRPSPIIGKVGKATAGGRVMAGVNNNTRENDIQHGKLGSLDNSTGSPPIPLTNRTLESARQGKIVIIKPSSPNSSQLINDPIQIVKLLKQSPFDDQEIVDIRVNKRKNILVAELESPNQVLLNKLLKVTELGKWKVKCYQPNSDSVYHGVIYPISETVELDELKELINTHSEHSTVIDVVRLYRKVEGEWRESSSVKLTFSGAGKVDSVTMGHSYYRVRPYVMDPIQCYNCQILGHTSIGCDKKQRCMLCAAEHHKKHCTVPPDRYKCANCGGNHPANSKLCIRIQQACTIEKIKVQSNCTHQAARSKFINSLNQNNATNQNQRISNDQAIRQPQNTPSNAHGNYGSSHIEPPSRDYANAVMGRKRHPPIEKTYNTISTQTDTDSSNEINGKLIMEKIGSCLMELLAHLGIGNQDEKQSELISTIVQKHLGKETIVNQPLEIVNKDTNLRKRPAESEDSSDYETEDDNEDDEEDEGEWEEVRQRKGVKGKQAFKEMQYGDKASSATDSPIFLTVEKKQIRVDQLKCGETKPREKMSNYRLRSRKKRNKKKDEY